MKNSSTKIIKKIQKIKSKTRNKNLRFKLELFILGIKLGNISEACARRGVGRTFYHKWWRRFKNSNFKLKSLEEKSRKPKKSPRKLSYHFERKILEMNSKGYGARMIQALFKRQNKKISTSTICHILNKRKKIKKSKKKLLKGHRRRYELPIPGQRVQIDVKYVPNLIRGQRAYCFSAVDECTRIKFSYCYLSLSEYNSFDFLEKMKEDFPFPINTIQTDNGFEFTNRFNHFKENWDHSVSVWCKNNDVIHRCIPPGAKELNGKIERSHRIDEQYFYWRAPNQSVEGLNYAMKEWLKDYNKTRPHGGIGYLTPYEKYQERINNLPKERLDANLWSMRYRFLVESPAMYLKKEKPSAYRKYKLAA